MSDPYQKVKIGKLTFKGGESLEKKKKRKKKKSKDVVEEEVVAEGVPGPEEEEEEGGGGRGGGEEFYTIDAAKKMKYEDLFPVETKKFGYDPMDKEKKSTGRSVEERLDDRVKKKADRYCK